jgi:hypothetical protein
MKMDCRLTLMEVEILLCNKRLKRTAGIEIVEMPKLFVPEKNYFSIKTIKSIIRDE